MTRSAARGNVSPWVLVAIALVVLLGGAAGLVAVALFSGVAPQPAVEQDADSLLREAREDAPMPEPRTPEPPPAPQPELAGRSEVGQVERLQRRLGDLERKVALLEAELKAIKEKAGGLLEMLAQGQPGGIVIPGGRLPEGLEIPDDVPVPDGVMGPGTSSAQVAKKLGLDARRTAAMAEEYERVMAEIEALEKQHATVTREGDTTTIKIGRFADDGARLRRRWDDWLDANLTPEERSTYDEGATTNRLLGNRLGSSDRTVTIQEADGSVTIKDATGSGDGTRTMQQIQGPAIARDAMLAPYRHLLK